MRITKLSRSSSGGYRLPIRHAKQQPGKVPLGEKPDLVTPSDSPGNNIRLLHCDGNEVLQSGKELSSTTPDPDRYPLPSSELLEMQRILHRTSGFRGAADGDNDSDGGGGDGLELREARDDELGLCEVQVDSPGLENIQPNLHLGDESGGGGNEEDKSFVLNLSPTRGRETSQLRLAKVAVPSEEPFAS